MLECIDLFCGAGGLSLGLDRAGIRVRAAVDQDADCKSTYTSHFKNVSFIQSRIQQVDVDQLTKRVKDPERLILAGGPPCQLFSRLNRAPAEMTDELVAYVKLVKLLRPAFVVFENVPAILRRSLAWNFVLSSLQKMKYLVEFGVLAATDFNIPQHRRRLIVIAGRERVTLPEGNAGRVLTLRDAISHLPDRSDSIPNHVGFRLSAENLKRIRQLKAGELSKQMDDAFRDSYARMEWDKPAPTITTKCISFSNGRFGHPEYDRAITVREAAIIQGFPDDFIFEGCIRSAARQVGNAVPPPISEAIGRQILRAFEKGRQRSVIRKRIATTPRVPGNRGTQRD